MFSNLKILVTNDDGIDSLGLKVLVEKLKTLTNDILVVAPNKQMSATSHKITIHEGILLKKEEDIFKNVLTYSISGTPVDCVNIAINLLKFRPNVIFSGVNNGFNLGTDILYSATVASACEGANYNILGIAISCDVNNLEGMKYFDDIISYMRKTKIYKQAEVLNINIPRLANNIQITHQGVFPFQMSYVQKDDGLYYINSVPLVHSIYNNMNSDVYAIYHNSISITPLTNNQTDFKLYEKWKKINI